MPGTAYGRVGDRLLPPPEHGRPSQAVALDLAWAFQMVRRRLWLAVGITVGLTALVALAVGLLPDRWTAEALVVLNARPAKIASLQLPTESLLSRTDADLSVVRTETEIITSDGLLRTTAERLGLATDAAFVGNRQGDDRSHNVAAITFEWSVAVARRRLRPRYGRGCGDVALNLRWQPDLRETASGGADAPARGELPPAERARVLRGHAAQRPVPDRGLCMSGTQQASDPAQSLEFHAPHRRGPDGAGPGR